MSRDLTPALPIPAAPLPGSTVEGLDGFTHRYAKVNGTRIHFVAGGQGPAVMLLHGFPYTWAAWAPTMALLAAAGFTAIAPDLRGLGDSDEAEDGFSKANVAEDVHAVALGLGFPSVTLVGMDIGAMVAFAYAILHPDEVGHLVLCESLLPGFGLEELMNPAMGGYWHFGFHIQVDLAAMLTQGREEAYLMPFYRMMSTSPEAETWARSEVLPHYAGPRGLRGGLQHYGTLLEDGRSNRIALTSRLPMPVLVLNGDSGLPQAPLLAGTQAVAERVEADVVPGSGHLLGRDNPGWVADRIAKFALPRTADGGP